MPDAQQKPEIEFPCHWGYKVIGLDQEAVAEAVLECVGVCLGTELGDRNMKLDLSRKSTGGKYVSWSLGLRVDSLAERDKLFAALAGHADITMVI